ncbi:hypothetical protein A4A49_26269 [Nicotiana attenuata]|uniref:Uncharacterized protein n=1 Tax=Nicotiana attenuata TaxID=49451 RepID=A0A1J6K7Q4_NICAT|nr:hypothetical protein A4A49_26269 [Nicotiana attenuata]
MENGGSFGVLVVERDDRRHFGLNSSPCVTAGKSSAGLGDEEGFLVGLSSMVKTALIRVSLASMVYFVALKSLASS